MADNQPKIEKARLVEIKFKKDKVETVPGGKNVAVQFNPEALKVSFANQIVQSPEKGSDQNGPSGSQFVGAGTTKLALTIWFDVTALPDGENTTNDVRILTEEVAYFIKPQGEAPKQIPPGVRFEWGSFSFDGLMDSMEENLEYFSNDGRPLRASIAFTLSQQRFQFARQGMADGGKRPPPPPNAPASALGADRAATGAAPLTPAPAGVSLQAMADAAGLGDRWQEIAAANGIVNPRLMQPGQLIDLDARLPGPFGRNR